MKTFKESAKELIAELETKQRKKQLAEDGLALIVHGRVSDKAEEHAARTADAAKSGGIAALIEQTYAGGRFRA